MKMRKASALYLHDVLCSIAVSGPSSITGCVGVAVSRAWHKGCIHGINSLHSGVEEEVAEEMAEVAQC